MNGHEDEAVDDIDIHIRHLKSDIMHTQESAIRYLSSQGARAVPALIREMTSGDETMHDKATRALAAIGKPAIDDLLEALDDPRPHARKSIIYVLGTIEKKTGEKSRSARRIMTALFDEPGVVQAAAFTLGWIRYKPALKALIGFLDNENRVIAGSALDGLGWMGDARALAPLEKMLARERDYDARKSICDTILDICDTTLRERNKKLLKMAVDEAYHILEIGEETAIERCASFFKTASATGIVDLAKIRESFSKRIAIMPGKQVAKMYTDISKSVAKSKKKIWTDGEILSEERLKPPKGSRKDGMFRNVSGSNLRKTGWCG